MPAKDPIIEEIHRVREKIARQADYDMLPREEHAPIANAQPENLGLSIFEAFDVSELSGRQPFERSHDPVACTAVQTGRISEGTLCPADLERQASPKRRFRASS